MDGLGGLGSGPLTTSHLSDLKRSRPPVSRYAPAARKHTHTHTTLQQRRAFERGENLGSRLSNLGSQGSTGWYPMGPSMDDCAEDPQAPRSSPEDGVLPVTRSAMYMPISVSRPFRQPSRDPLGWPSPARCQNQPRFVPSSARLPASIVCSLCCPAHCQRGLWALRV